MPDFNDKSGSPFAFYEGKEIYAVDFKSADWEVLKATYRVGEIVMPCCETAAVPKTSQNGLHFFAHHNGECSTAPETIWHQKTKAHIADALQRYNIVPKLEFTDRINRKWKADVFFEHRGQHYAIEIQRSYQHLREYLRRQQAYNADSVRCYWLLHIDRYKTLVMATAKHRIKHEFGGRCPKEGLGPCLADLPVAFATNDPFEIKGAGSLSTTCDAWIAAILTDGFVWTNGSWHVRNA